MERAVKEAIRQGGIRDLPYEDQILVGRALLIIKAVPDEERVNQFEEDRCG